MQEATDECTIVTRKGNTKAFEWPFGTSIEFIGN
jgi:hypothetical protein